MERVGYAYIREGADTCKGALRPDEFIGKPVVVMEFASDGGVLCLNLQGSALAMFDKQDVQMKFECGFYGEHITPPNLTNFEQAVFVASLPPMEQYKDFRMVRSAVIVKSLFEGEFNDEAYKI